jgi:ABC-type antimicrobial peptide transport system permease subunit
MSSQQNHAPRKRYAAIPLRVLFHVALSGIRHKKLRSILTILGVVVGIGAIFFMLSFGLGLQLVVSKQVIGDKSIKSIEVSSPNSRIIKLDEPTLNKIRGYPHVENTGTLYSYPGSVSIRSSEVNVIAYGVDEGYIELTSLNMTKGRTLKRDDARVVMVNESALKSLGIENHDEAIGTKLQLNIPLTSVVDKKSPIKDEFEIVGVLDTGSGTEVYLPGYVYANAGVNTLSQLKLLADNTENIPELRKQIESNGLQTTSPIDTLDQINRIFKFFNFMLLSFGAIGMIVSVLGMFNTLTISLLEKTQEIGLMMALGARRSDMRRLFVIEATFLAAAGAVLGIIGASLNGIIIDVYLNNLAQSRGVDGSFTVFSRPMWLAASLFFFMILVALVVVYLPARRAERINPIDALRRQ